MSSGLPVQLIFPMAGRGLHGGYKFRPFVRVGEETMIEAALRPFRGWRDVIRMTYFVCLQEQEDEFWVSKRLAAVFPDWPFEVILLEKATSGPAETVRAAIEKRCLTGPGIICDSDHSVDVTPQLQRLTHDAPDCLVPVWDLRGEDLKAWSVAAVDDSGRVIDVAEKKVPACSGRFFGVIGCYYFRELRELTRSNGSYLSQSIRRLLDDRRRVEAVSVETAEFFGDRTRLNAINEKRRSYCGTIFCDLDGTLVEHEDQPSYTHSLKVLPGTREKLAEWQQQGYHIALMTARPVAEEELLRQSLAAADVRYHRLIMGLPSGPRFLINDRRPSAMLTPQVGAFEVARNEGIHAVALPASRFHVCRRFQGGSYAETLLVEDDEKMFVRKRASKREHLSLGYSKLKSQFRSLERFAQLAPSIVPALYGEHESTFEYYYEMEYLSGHQLLSHYSGTDRQTGLELLLNTLQEKIYSTVRRNGIDPGDWLLHHFSQKVFPKLDLIRAHPRLSEIFAGADVRLNGVEYPSLDSLLQRALEPAMAKELGPKVLSPVHGDLTFENVLYDRGDIKLIDMDGAEPLDALELDLGKLFQSVLCHYEDWAHSTAQLSHREPDGNVHLLTKNGSGRETVQRITQCWASVLGLSEDQTYRKGLFFLGLHLIRMAPFRLKVSDDQATFALANALIYLNAAIRA